MGECPGSGSRHGYTDVFQFGVLDMNAVSQSFPLQRSHPDELLVGLVSVSDRASSGSYEDRGIPALTEWLQRALIRPPQVVSRLIPDEREGIDRKSTRLNSSH